MDQSSVTNGNGITRDIVAKLWNLCNVLRDDGITYLVGRRNFLRFLPGWVLIMAFFLYCFVHDAFDQATQTRRVVVPRMEYRPVRPVPASIPKN